MVFVPCDESGTHADYQQMYERWHAAKRTPNDGPHPESPRHIELAVAEGNVCRIVAEARPVRFTIVSRRTEYGVPTLDIVDILIDPECARRGIGRRFLQTACKRQMADFTKALLAHVYAANDRSIGLLQAIGLQEISRFAMRPKT